MFSEVAGEPSTSCNLSKVAISVTNVSKCFQIYAKPHQRLLQSLFRGSRKYYEEFWALKDISLTIMKGETVGIIGRNGAGKSTLLQLVCGILTPSTGEVVVNGRVAALLELGAGFNPEFTGRENIYMSATILGLTRQQIDSRYNDIIEFASIGNFVNQPVKTYSSGMYVRLAFAVIAHVDADILIIDEALAVGDVFFTQKCMRFLRKFMESGTVLFVSHDTASVVNLCDSAIMLSNGAIKATGSPKSISEMYLAELYNSETRKSSVGAGAKREFSQPAKNRKDMRQDFINNSLLRNDVEVFEFDFSVASFGASGASITGIELCDLQGRALSWVVGGEQVVLEISCKARQVLYAPIVGFVIKDKLGQALFGDNTFLTCMGSELEVQDDERFSASFEFEMPILPMGDYTLSAALAEGTQENHVQHCWLHDAVSFKSHSSSKSTGLIGIPMRRISFRKRSNVDNSITC